MISSTLPPTHARTTDIADDLELRLQAAVGTNYRILKELGGGGMSRVFLAEEPRLGRQVVIKLLPPEMGAAVNVERFEREIQLAARLQHPHVVSLLTAGASDDLLYYIMPFIAGESLRTRLSREGALPLAEAVRILREIVDALAYAHSNSVVHRDIKPDNVLLSTGHAVVTDFGVAKAVSASSGGHSSLTSLGVALGTPAYMAPEQAAADPHVDHRADIYAVGALGYEMLTGRTPFVAPTPQAMLAAHITQSPDPLTRHRPAVPAALNGILMRCLEKHPADRWQTAGELLTQLETVLTPSGGLTPSEAEPAISSGTAEALRKSQPVRVILAFTLAAVGTLAVVYLAVQQFGLPDWVFYGAVLLFLLGLPITLATGYFERKRAQARATGRIVSPTLSGVHRFFTWRTAIRGGLIAFAGLGLVTLGYTAMRLLGIGPVGTLMAAGTLESDSHLLVADFVNRTADTTLGHTLTEAFRIDLGQSRAFHILSGSDMHTALGRMQKPDTTLIAGDVAREMAVREGAKAVITTELSNVGSSYVLVSRILDASDGHELVALRETAPDDAGLIAAVDRLSGRVRERIGESLKTIRGGAPLDRVTTGSLEALRLYSEAVPLSDGANYAAAIPLLRQAVAIDTGFAMAWRKLAAALGGSGTDPVATKDAATRAYRLRDRLPELERQATIAFYYTIANYDEGKAIEAYRRMLAIDSSSSLARGNLALLYDDIGRCAEATTLARGGGVPRGEVLAPLVYSLTCTGNFAEADRELANPVGLDTASFIYLAVRAGALALEAQDDTAAAAWRRAIRSAPDSTTMVGSYYFLGTVELARGRWTDFHDDFTPSGRITEAAAISGDPLEAAALIATSRLMVLHDSAGATRDLEAALKRYPLASTPVADWPAGELASVEAMLGPVGRAKQLLASYKKGMGDDFNPDQFWDRSEAWVAMREGRPQDAIAILRAMRRRGHFWAAHWESGLAFEQAGMPDSAIAHYELAALPNGT
ncbi:MAG TPA: protein kinase, partial [Gemmatimonadales bacterium]|nr:protein kinase [Gemmatimonadales bacterium]